MPVLDVESRARRCARSRQRLMPRRVLTWLRDNRLAIIRNNRPKGACDLAPSEFSLVIQTLRACRGGGKIRAILAFRAPWAAIFRSGIRVGTLRLDAGACIADRLPDQPTLAVGHGRQHGVGDPLARAEADIAAAAMYGGLTGQPVAEWRRPRRFVDVVATANAEHDLPAAAPSPLGLTG